MAEAAGTPTETLPWGTTPEGAFTKNGTIVAAVMGTYGVFITFPLGVLGIVLSCRGLDRIPRRDPSARRFLLWSWICFLPGTAIGVPLTLILVLGLLNSLFT